MSKNVFFTHYNRPPSVFAELDFTTCFVSQSEADMCCLQNQLRRYGQDGLEAKMQALQDKFGYADCTKVGTFAEIQNKYRKGVEYFEALPSSVRERFRHRADIFYDFIENNQEQAIKEGFVKPIEKVDVVKDDVVKDVVDTGLKQDVSVSNGSLRHDNTSQSEVP